VVDAVLQTLQAVDNLIAITPEMRAAEIANIRRQ
jgi:hypothetical protein